MRLAVDQIAALLRDVPDFPEPGIVFKDLTPLLADPQGFASVIDHFTEQASALAVDAVVGIESRGFLLGAPIALNLEVGLVPARKVGKLPCATESVTYDLEYGTATLEMHTDAITPGQRVLIVDDVLATGGTAAATAELVRRLGGEVVGCHFLLELGFLHGRKRLDELDVWSLLTS